MMTQDQVAAAAALRLKHDKPGLQRDLARLPSTLRETMDLETAALFFAQRDAGKPDFSHVKHVRDMTDQEYQAFKKSIGLRDSGYRPLGFV